MRRHLRRQMHDRVAHRQCVGHKPRRLDQRHIEWRDHRDNAQRLTDRHRKFAWSIRRDRLTPHVAAHTGGGTHHRQALGHLEHGLLNRRTNLVDEAIDQIVFALFHQLRNAKQPPLALGRSGLLVGRERRFGRRDPFAHIVARATGHMRINTVIQRIDVLESGTTFGIDPLPADEVLQCPKFSFRIHVLAPKSAFVRQACPVRTARVAGK